MLVVASIVVVGGLIAMVCSGMRIPILSFVGSAILAVAAIGITVTTAYPEYMRTYTDAFLWAIWDSAFFLLTALISGFYAIRRRSVPLSRPVVAVLVSLWIIGVVWAWLYLIVLGL